MNKRSITLVLALVFLEWLDFSLYLYLAKTIFAPQFFPPTQNSLTLSFALFAAAYFARPLGGWIFGVRADKRGRRQPMLFSAGLMGFATLGICLLPGYAVIGIGAAWGLLLLRIAQGLALGGEINTSAMFLMEHQSRGALFAGSCIAASGALGMFMGGAIASLLQYFSSTQAWRWVFCIVGLLSLWVCRRRKQLLESPEFSPLPAERAIHWLDYKQNLLNIALAGAYVSVTVYMCNVVWVSFAIDVHLWSKVVCTWAGSLAQLCSALLALPIARIINKEQAYNLLYSSMILAAISSPLLFYCTAIQSHTGVLFAILGYILANGLLCSSVFYILYLQLPASIRCRGVSTIWAFAASLGAISLPLAERSLAKGWIALPGLLVSVLAMAALMFLRQVNSDVRLSFMTQDPTHY